MKRIKYIKNEKYFNNYMLENKPVIIEDVNINEWLLYNYFINKDSLKYSPELFLNICQNEIIPIHDNSQNSNHQNKIEDMEIKDFMNKINSGDSLYAKDWHIFQYISADKVYNIPEFFIDDWLNWYWKYCRNSVDDYRFVYIGGKDTTTGVHHDVLYSYSWSVNLYGKKIWRIWSPNEVSKLQSITLPKLHVSDARDGMYDLSKYPHVNETNPIIIEQDVNEVIFIPSGWYHMVENINSLTPNITISLNHNWFNSYSLHLSWIYLLNQHHLVCHEIEMFYPNNSISSLDMCMSLEEWYQHSQFLLGLQAGMNLLEFISLICLRHYRLSLVVINIKRNLKNNSNDYNEGFVSHDSRLIPILYRYVYNLSHSENKMNHLEELNQEEKENKEEKFQKHFIEYLRYNELDEKVYNQLDQHTFSIDKVPQQSFENIDHPLYNTCNLIIDGIRQESLNEYTLRSNKQNMIINGWIYCQLQVQVVLRSLLYFRDNQTNINNNNVYQIICNEINYSENENKNDIEVSEIIDEYLQSINNQLYEIYYNT